MADISQTDARNTLISKPVPHSRSTFSSPPQETKSPLDTSNLVAPWQVMLEIHTDTTRFLRLELPRELLIGRPDFKEQHIPDLDVSGFGIQGAGVSRRHAAIYATQTGLYIRDLASTNGTVVNGFRLEPGRLYQIQDGDKIELGRLSIKLNVLKSPQSPVP